MTTAYQPPTVLDALRAMPGVTVELRPVDPDLCDWCADDDAHNTVVIYGDPWPTVCTECCSGCAVDLVGRALAEQDPFSRQPIRVEVDAR